MPDDPFDSRILAFERVWQQHGFPEICAFLTSPFAQPSPARTRLLLELVCIDLEFRWRQPTCTQAPPTLEDYLRQFPELGPIDRLPLDLIAEEYRVRQRWGDHPPHDAITRRFPDRHAAIDAALHQVEQELEAEDPPRQRPAATGQATPSAEVPADISLLDPQDFLLKRLIGSGRMGKVYEALDRAQGREVAVKFLRKSFLSDARIVRRFIGEFQVVARLRHPRVVAVHGLGRTSGGSYFLVMDLVPGPNLAVVSQTRPIGLDEAIAWTLDVCRALEHSHERGIIHCDLKPANLLLDPTGAVRVTDFGLARSTTEQTPWTAELEGTAPFMAPEQVSSAWGPIDQRTDVYGVGAILFTLLSGHPPCPGQRLPDILAQVVSATPIALPARLRADYPPVIADLCLKCLSKAPSARYPTIADLRADLEHRCQELENRS